MNSEINTDPPPKKGKFEELKLESTDTELKDLVEFHSESALK